MKTWVKGGLGWLKVNLIVIAVIIIFGFIMYINSVVRGFQFDIGDISPVLFAAFSCLIPAFVMGAAVGELKNKTSWLRGGLTAVAIDLVFLLGAIIFVFVFSYIFKIDLGGSEFTGMAIGIIFLFGVAGIIPLFIIGAVIGWLINRGEETCQKIN